MFISIRKHKAAKATLMASLVLLLLTGETAMSYEEPDYTVVYRDGDLEYRQYEPYLVSETVIDTARDADAASKEGFRRLFRYITGANKSQSKIAMTTPVSQSASEKISMTVPVQQAAAENGWRVSFALPADYTMETAPQPADPRVYVREVPGRLMAVKRFAGRWTESNYTENERELERLLAEQDLALVGEIERAAYNAPFSLPFFRRNEVMVAVNRLPESAMAAGEAATVVY
jgi:hypothetical protein